MSALPCVHSVLLWTGVPFHTFTPHPLSTQIYHDCDQNNEIIEHFNGLTNCWTRKWVKRPCNHFYPYSYFVCIRDITRFKYIIWIKYVPSEWNMHMNKSFLYYRKYQKCQTKSHQDESCNEKKKEGKWTQLENAFLSIRSGHDAASLLLLSLITHYTTSSHLTTTSPNPYWSVAYPVNFSDMFWLISEQHHLVKWIRLTS